MGKIGKLTTYKFMSRNVNLIHICFYRVTPIFTRCPKIFLKKTTLHFSTSKQFESAQCTLKIVSAKAFCVGQMTFFNLTRSPSKYIVCRYLFIISTQYSRAICPAINMNGAKTSLLSRAFLGGAEAGP